MKISKRGKLYTFYDKLSTSWFYDIHIPREQDGTLSMFNDKCSFIKTNISLVMWTFVFISMVIGMAIATIVVAYITYDYVLTGSNDKFEWSGLFVFVGIIVGSYLYAYITTKNNDNETFIDSFFEVIKDRSDKYCTKIDVDD